MVVKIVAPEDYLMHHGIKGQQWGQRRWQNEDGSLTPAGREHYGYKGNKYDRYEQKVRSRIEGKAEATYAERKKINPNLTKNENRSRVASVEIQDENRKMARNKLISSGLGIAGWLGGVAGTVLTGNPAFFGITVGSIVGSAGYNMGSAYCDSKREIRLNDIANDYNLREVGDAKNSDNFRKIR